MTITQKKPSRFLRAAFRAPIFLYRMKLGFLLGRRFLMLTHMGRISGNPYQTVIEVVSHDKKTDTYYVAAAWREKSDWYLNILQRPKAKVQVGNMEFQVEAAQVSNKEAELVYWEYAQRHPFAMRELSSILLGERLTPTRRTCEQLSKAIPVIALKSIF